MEPGFKSRVSVSKALRYLRKEQSVFFLIFQEIRADHAHLPMPLLWVGGYLRPLGKGQRIAVEPQTHRESEQDFPSQVDSRLADRYCLCKEEL